MTTRENIGAICEVIKLIPQGNVATYGQIAELVQLPGYARWIAYVLKTEPMEGIPWHRVIRSDGHIADHPSSQRQIDLLKSEGVQILENQVSLKDFRWNPKFQ